MALSTAERSRRWRSRCATVSSDNYMKLKQEIDTLRNEMRHGITAILLALNVNPESLRNGARNGAAPSKESFPPLGPPSLSDSPTLPLPLPSEKKKERIITRVFDPRFARWYEGYPKKVGKGEAERAYRKARKIATEEELAAGLDRYVEHNPKDHPWCNPATWLNQERWNDEYGNGRDKQLSEYEARAAIEREDIFRRLALGENKH